MVNEVLKIRALWAITLLLALGMTLRAVRPLQDANSSEIPFWDQHPVRTKLEIATSSASKPQFVLLGSSLAMRANYEADRRAANERALFGGDYNRYSATEFLGSKLSQALDMPISGLNVTCPACMVADTDSILKELYAGGAAPEFAIYCIAPRDFMDNVAGEHMYHSFAVQPHTWWQEVVSHFKARELTQGIDQLFSAICHTYCVRVDYQLVSALAARTLMNKLDVVQPQAVASATNKQNTLAGLREFRDMDAPMGKQRMQHHKQDYLRRYRPFAQTAFDKQWEHMSSIAEMCKRNGTTLYLVNMPISSENEKLMDDGLEQRYRANLSSFCSNHGILMIDLPKLSKFDDSNFRDTVHLRAVPSQTALTLIASQVAQDQLAQHQSLAGRASAVSH